MRGVAETLRPETQAKETEKKGKKEGKEGRRRGGLVRGFLRPSQGHHTEDPSDHAVGGVGGTTATAGASWGARGGAESTSEIPRHLFAQEGD